MANNKPKFAIVFVLFFITVLFNFKGIMKPNLNLVCCQDLQQVQGIGEVKASKIIEERGNGKYISFCDLGRRNDGIGRVLVPRLAENFIIRK